ncbi:hypothetical protein AB0A73_17325 [Glycomyces sp. NPDC047369]
MDRGDVPVVLLSVEPAFVGENLVEREVLDPVDLVGVREKLIRIAPGNQPGVEDLDRASVELRNGISGVLALAERPAVVVAGLIECEIYRAVPGSAVRPDEDVQVGYPIADPVDPEPGASRYQKVIRVEILRYMLPQ